MEVNFHKYTHRVSIKYQNLTYLSRARDRIQLVFIVEEIYTQSKYLSGQDL